MPYISKVQHSNSNPMIQTGRPSGMFLIISLFVLNVIFIPACTDEQSASEEWVHLFNGENFDGWDIKITGYELNDNFANTFRIEDGLLKVRYDQYERFDGQVV